MNIETIPMGPNSAAIYFDTSSLPSDYIPVCDAIVNYISQHGWELHDEFEQKTAYTNNIQSRVKVFRAPMVDNPTVYKYMALYLINNTAIRVCAWESWNPDTHVGINSCYITNPPTSSDYFVFNLSGYKTVYLFVTARYMYMFGSDSGGNLNVNAVSLSEISKDNAGEVTGEYPRYLTCSMEKFYELANSQGYDTNNPSQGISWRRIPRAVNNQVGAAQWLSNGLTVVSFSYNSKISKFPNHRNPFDPDKVPVFNLYVIEPTNEIYHVRGKIFGAKAMMDETGNFLDTINIPCNEDGFFDKDGETVEHYIVPIPSIAANFKSRIALPK